MTAADFRVESIPVNDVFITGSRRLVDDAAVSALAESIKENGLQTPITVRIDPEIPDPETGEVMGAYALITGAHRIAAFRLLGRDRIPAIIRTVDKIDAELLEIAENLHRADLTKEQRDRDIRRYADLLRKRQERLVEGGQVAQTEPPVLSDGRKKGPQHEKGVAKKIAEQTGLSKSTVQRALSQQSGISRRAVKVADDPLTDEEAAEKQYAGLVSAWNKAGETARRRFRELIDEPVMDRRYG